MTCKFHKVLIEIKPSCINGVGVFAIIDFKKGQRVAEGVHEDDYKHLIPWDQIEECDDEIRKKILSFCVGAPSGFLPPESLDFNTLSVDWYINHSCDGNLGFNRTGDLVARSYIRKGQELTYDYGLAESNPEFRMACKCGSKKCRKLITGNDWKNKQFRRDNMSYMLPALRKLKTS